MDEYKVGELMEAATNLVEMMRESHQSEIGNDHFGDGPEGCTYCEAIAETEAAVSALIVPVA